MVTSSVTSGNEDARDRVPVAVISMVSDPADPLAAVIASRSDPAPASAVLVTVSV